MSRALREFFVQEASEYLDKLAAVLVDDHPDFDRARRLARALTGSARMADQEAIADAAAALQAVSGELARGERHWDDELASSVKSALAGLRELIDAVLVPPPDLADRARELARQLGAGEPGQPGAPSEPSAEDDQRFQGYLGTELRRLATAIDDAVEVLERDPSDREPLKRLLRRIRPLRGVQSLGEVRAVGPALSALEEVILRIADTSAAVGPGHLTLFRRAREALAEVAQDFLRGVEPSARAGRHGEIEDLKDQVLETPAQRGVLWISELYYEDGGPHLESCPMAERGAGSWEAFFTLEATGSLDTADRLRAEMVRDEEGIRNIGERLAYTFRQLKERSVTFGHDELGRVAGRIAALLRAGLKGPPNGLKGVASSLEPAIAALRRYLGSPDVEVQRSALAEAEAAVDRAARSKGETPVPVEDLVYDRDEALSRALDLRTELSELLGRDAGDEGRLRQVTDELFALIEHALERSRTGR